MYQTLDRNLGNDQVWSKLMLEIEEIIMNAEVQGKCNMFDNPEANLARNTISSIDSNSSFDHDVDPISFVPLMIVEGEENMVSEENWEDTGMMKGGE